jgi:DNA-directed RNA polymerase subunit RPC12/RpoP
VTKGYNGLHCKECGEGYYDFSFKKQKYVCVDCGDEIR